MLKHLDLFSGIGGFSLACEWVGIETIGFVEIDKYCQKVLRKHWPDVPLVEDIRDVEKIKTIANSAFSCRQEKQVQTGRQTIALRTREPRSGDLQLQCSAILITAGFPCQPFSVAGKRGGESDDCYLWPQTIAVIKAIKPKWVLLENVTGIIKLALDTVLSDLEGAGYSHETLIIPACAVNAWHRRDRIWIVANDNSVRNKWRPDQFRCGTSLQYEVGAGSQDVANTPNRVTQPRGPQCDVGGFQSQILREGRGPDYWAVEPELGRVAARISPKLDGGRIDGNEMDSKEKSSEELYLVWEALRGMWDKQEFTETPSQLRGRSLPDFMSGLPYKGRPTMWHTPSKENEELYSLWERVSTLPFPEAQLLLPELLEYIGKAQCYEAVASIFDGEPSIPRIATGVKNRVDRLKCLGNAIVPQVAYEILKAIVEVEARPVVTSQLKEVRENG